MRIDLFNRWRKSATEQTRSKQNQTGGPCPLLIPRTVRLQTSQARKDAYAPRHKVCLPLREARAILFSAGLRLFGPKRFCRKSARITAINCNHNKTEPDNRRTKPGQTANAPRTLSGYCPVIGRTHLQTPYAPLQNPNCKNTRKPSAISTISIKSPQNPRPFPTSPIRRSKSPAISRIRAKIFASLRLWAEWVFKKRNRASLRKTRFTCSLTI
jgi:hypothetical protein